MSIGTALDRLYSLRQLQEAGYGDRTTLTRRIHNDELPAVKVGNRYMVREADLTYLAEPANDVEVKQSSERAMVESFDDLASLSASLVSAWPRLSDERKRELGALLATP